MNTQMYVNINDAASGNENKIEVFSNEDWNSDTQHTLMRLLPEIFLVLKDGVDSLKISISVDVDDPRSLIARIREKRKSLLDNRSNGLSNREKEILTLIMNGYTNQEIANKLSVSYETVRSHRKNILQRTGCKNTAALVNHYHQHC